MVLNINITLPLNPEICIICHIECCHDGLLHPAKCNNYKKHSICHNCWWNPIDGFAIEGKNHECPGCVK